MTRSWPWHPSSILICIVIFVASIAAQSIVNTVELKIPVAGGQSCASQNLDYYDSTQFVCKACTGTGKVVDTSVVDPLGNYVQCKCATGYVKTPADCSKDTTGNCQEFTCSPCSSRGLAAYSDGSGCAGCAKNGTLGLSNGECACKTGYAVVESDAAGNKLTNKTCIACPAGKAIITSSQQIAGVYYTASPYSCQSCPDPLMSMSSGMVCTCPSGYTIVGVTTIGPQSCLPNTLGATYLQQVGSAQNVKYPGAGVTVISSIMQHYYANAATRCMFYGGPHDNIYCQILANLCVLQMYDDQTPACSSFNAIISSRGTTFTNNVVNWPNELPWLFYAGASAACFDTGFNQRVSLKNSLLNYVLGTYHMNGTFAGFQPLGTTLQYCTRGAPYSGLGGGTGTSNYYLNYAAGLTANYTCDLQSLLTQQQMFYELYIQDGLSTQLYPVPARVTNLRSGSGGGSPNKLFPEKYLCDATDSLVRRFFLFDAISGISAGSTAPLAMRYAQYLSLEVTLVPGNGRQIYAPVLTLQFAEVVPAKTVVTYTVDVKYSIDTNSFNTTLFGFFIGGIVAFGLIFLLRYMHWNTRNTRSLQVTVITTSLGGINLKVILQLAYLIMHTWNLMFFPFTVLVCWFLLLFFKLQNVPSLMLPPMINLYNPTSTYYSFTCMLHVLAFFQLACVLITIYRQSYADIFFLDWEPDRGNKGHVSVWRTIMVAREWMKMQTMRRTDVKFTLFWLVFVLIGMNLQYTATQQTDLTNLTPGTQNVVLRFGNTTFWWLLFAFVQWIWKYFIYERFIKEPPEQIFVDFCTLAQISILVLDEDYHGYYLHCRSPHEFADGTMDHLINTLRNEEAGLVTDRSMDNAPKDVQSFEVFLTGSWREKFNVPFQKIVQAPSLARMKRDEGGRPMTINDGISSGAGVFTRGARGLRRGGVPPSEKVLQAWKELSIFLRAFIDGAFQDKPMKIEHRQRDYVETIRNAPPDLTPAESANAFYPDRKFNYSKMLFLGKERDLLMLNILSYSIFDYWLNNTGISVLLTYLLDFVLCRLRRELGESNIAKKTLIDERFLF